MYHCTQHKGKHPGIKWLKEEEITKQLADIFKRLQIPEDVCAQIREKLKENHKYKIEFETKYREELQRELNRQKKMQDNNYKAYLEERITVDVHDKYNQEFEDKMSEINTRLAMLEEINNKYFETAKSILLLSQRAKELFESSNAEEKSLLVNMVLLNLTVDNEKVLYEAKSPFNKILEFADCHSWGG